MRTLFVNLFGNNLIYYDGRSSWISHLNIYTESFNVADVTFVNATCA